MNSQLEIKLAPTPETDRRIITQDPRMCGCGYKSEIVFADFARRLERERDILKKHISIMDISHKTANDEYFELAAENEKLERERDEAREIF